MHLVSESVNLFMFPLKTMIVDDDNDYLDLLSKELKNINCSIFNSSEEIIKNLDPIHITINYFLEDNFIGIRDLNYSNIEQFVNKHENKQGILIADYSMPNINGIELLTKYYYATLRKILLTNVFTMEEAIDALHKKHINYYLPKERTAILLEVIKEQQLIFFEEITQSIIKVLHSNNSSYLKFLSDKIYINIFNEICQKYNIKKYYIINSYGNYYLENDTNKYIFSIYSKDDLIEIAKDFSEDSKYNIQHGNLIPSFFSEEHNMPLIEAIKSENYFYAIEEIKS